MGGDRVRRLGSLPVALLLLALSATAASAADDRARWQAQAARVEIVRDDWGIAHVHGHTDADAVFGMIYAHAETTGRDDLRVPGLGAIGGLLRACSL